MNGKVTTFLGAREGGYMAVYDPRRATTSVQTVVATFISHLVGGGYDGSIYSAETDCRKRLQQLGCPHDYIDSALEFAQTLGDSPWKRSSGPNDR
jgi:hypothetical protein